MGTEEDIIFLQKLPKYQLTQFSYQETEPSRILELLLEKLNQERPCFIYAYSMGGRLLLSLLNNLSFTPEKIILESVGFKSLNLQEKEDRANQDKKLAKKIEDNFEYFLKTWYRLPLWHFSDEEYHNVVKLRQKYRGREFLPEILLKFSPSVLSDLEHNLFEYGDKIHYLAGVKDQKYFSLAKELSVNSQFKGTIHLIENAGHNIHFQRPDEVLRILNESL